MPARISRATYADMYGPTTGDKLRLGDTEIIIEVERDLTTFGEGVKFGGGESRVLADMGQNHPLYCPSAVSTVIAAPRMVRIIAVSDIVAFLLLVPRIIGGNWRLSKFIHH